MDEIKTVVLCPHCHHILNEYGGCQNCIDAWLKEVYKQLQEISPYDFDKKNILTDHTTPYYNKRRDS